MGMQLGTVLKIVNDPTAGNAGDSTLIDAYTDRYEPRFDTIEKLNDALAEEGVAHFVELAYHGHWIDAEIAPVADELNAILSGAYGDQTTVAPDASSVMAAINSFDRQSVTPGLPMDKASRMARAKEMGFDTDEIYYHGTGTSRQIDEFGLKNRRGEMLPTFFVGEGNKRFANGFSTIEDGRIYPVHLNQSKFLDTKKASHRKALDDLIASNGLMPEEVYKKMWRVSVFCRDGAILVFLIWFAMRDGRVCVYRSGPILRV